MLRYPVSKPVLAGNESRFAADAIESGWISSTGPYVARFEQALDEFLGVQGCVAINNGTAALHLACMAMKLRPGDEVVVPALTYVASANAVAYCGARPVFADADPTTWNVTAETIERAWTPRTVGVVLVHLYGVPAPAEAIASLCRTRGAWLIEDCAESLGSLVGGRHTGTFGDAATFSFYGNKTISTGEGGMLFVKDAARRDLARMLRGQGMDPARRYWHPIIGYNYRMTNVAAAIGFGQMEMVSWHLAERQRVAAAYRAALADLKKEGLIGFAATRDSDDCSYWLFSLVLSNGGADRRESIMRMLLEEHGIETRPFFVPMHRLPMYADERRFANAEFLGDHGLNLPTYAGLSDAEVGEICRATADAIRRTARR